MQLSKEKLDKYKASAAHRWKLEQRQLSRSYCQGWVLAKKAAQLLKVEFGVH